MIIENVDKEFIFDRLSPEEIFCRYFSIPFIDTELFYVNPLRDDDFPSCRFYYNRDSGILYFNDFAWKSFDCIGYVQQAYALSYYDALYHIARTFNLLSTQGNNLKPIQVEVIKQELDIKVMERKLSNKDLQFWKNIDNSITEKELKDDHIHGLKAAWFNGKLVYSYTNGDVSFYYHLAPGYNYQLYNPNKFFGTTKFLHSRTDYLVGEYALNNECNYVLITKSVKDWFIAKRLGINAVAILSETLLIPKELMITFSKGKLIFTLFDNDRAGKLASIRYRNTYNTTPLLFPSDMEKDISDNCVKFGIDSVLEMVIETKEYYDLI
jgi:hypothetical protein